MEIIFYLFFKNKSRNWYGVEKSFKYKKNQRSFMLLKSNMQILIFSIHIKSVYFINK